MTSRSSKSRQQQRLRLREATVQQYDAHPYYISPRRSKFSRRTNRPNPEEPTSQITLPITAYGFQWGTTDSMEQSVEAVAVERSANSDAPQSINSTTDEIPCQVAHEIPTIITNSSGDSSKTAYAASAPAEEAVSGTLGQVTDEERRNYDPRWGMALSNSLINEPRDLGYRLWRVCGDHKLTNAAMEDIMAAIRITEELGECKRLPKEAGTLDTQMHVNDVELTYCQRCSICKKYKEWIYSKDSRNDVNKDRHCCGKPMLNTEDHFILLNPAHALSLALPTSFPKRRRELVSPEETKTYDDLGLKFEDDFSLTLNYDGVAMFKSCVRSLWPILATVDAIGAADKKRNVIVLGAYFGQKKEEPVTTTSKRAKQRSPEYCRQSFTEFMFKKLFQGLEGVRKEGVYWIDPVSKKERLSRCFVSKVLADSMGRPSIMGLMNLHGRFGCPVCYYDGCGHGRYLLQNMPELRSNESHREVLLSPNFVRDDPITFKGIKYASPFIDLPYFDLIWGFPIDAMHCIYLGVVKHLTLRWLERIRRAGGKSLPPVIDCKAKRLINAILARITPPHRVSRLCTSLDDAKGWKAHQWSMWLLFYSVPVLDGFLNPDQMDNWGQLVYAIAILSQSCVTEGDIQVAADHLEMFCTGLPTVYPHERESYPFNFHIMRHLPDFVRKHGSLPNFSMDPFESFNRELVGYSKGTLAVGLQVSKGYVRREIGKFMDAFSGCPEDSTIAKTYELRQPLRNLIPAAPFQSIIPSEDHEFFGVCVLPDSGERMTSAAYTRDGMKRSADAVMLRDGTVFVTEVFLKTSSGRIYAVGHQYELEGVSPFVHIFKEKEGSMKVKLVAVADMKEAVIAVKRDDRGTRYIRFLTAAEHVRS